MKASEMCNFFFLGSKISPSTHVASLNRIRLCIRCHGIRIYSRETGSIRCSAILVYFSVWDWTRVFYVIRFENIRIRLPYVIGLFVDLFFSFWGADSTK